MAVQNISDSEKTIKAMISAMSDDNYVIDKAILYCKYNSDVKIQFGDIIDPYRDYFEKYLITMDIPQKFYYQPARFAESYYGTPALDFLVLYFAGMTSLFEFKKPKIKVLDKTRLLEINRLFIQCNNQVFDSYNNPTEYIKENSLKTYL